MKEQITNYSKDSEYHTQRNNKEIPFLACNTTSMIMALKQINPTWKHFFRDDESLADIAKSNLEAYEILMGMSAIYELTNRDLQPFKDIFPAKLIQPEDYLTRYLQTERAYAEMKSRAPGAFRDGKALYKPQQVMNMLVWGLNSALGQDVANFGYYSLKTILDRLKTNGAVLNGIFPQKDADDIDHYVSIAGEVRLPHTHVDGTESLVPMPRTNLINIIIDDPFGDFRTNYKDHRGNDIRITKEEFVDIFKPCGMVRKWTITIGRLD